MHLCTLRDRLDGIERSTFSIAQRDCFIDCLHGAKLPTNSHALSVSTAEGVWDYFTLKTCRNVQKIVATGLVSNPVDPEGIKTLRSLGKWEFCRVRVEDPLPQKSGTFDLIYHLDVIEHVHKPYQFLSDQYRLLKKNGTLIIGTPNLFRPANIFKLIIGKLIFPLKMGHNDEIGDYVHTQEFYGQQLVILLNEVGFKNIQVTHCFFGLLPPLNITFTKYPQTKLGKAMCHYLMIKCNR